MSMQSFELGESTIRDTMTIEDGRPDSGGSARSRRKDEKRRSAAGSPYGGGVVNPRQAWLSSMHQGGGFNNTKSSGYGIQAGSPAPPKIRSKQVHRASHLDKEEMYDEIQKLKEIIASYSKERKLTQTNVAKLEKEITKKDKILESSFSQAQSTYGSVSERSFGGTSIETNSTILSLRQKCHKLECLVKDKDSEVKTLKANLKSTRLQELEIMCETYYQEITRLTRVMEQNGGMMTSLEETMTPRVMVTPRTSTPLHSSDKEKLLEGKIRELEVDNASLKKQLTSCGNQPSGNTAGILDEYSSLSRVHLEEQHQTVNRDLETANETVEQLRKQIVAVEDKVKQLTARETKQTENTEKLADDRLKLEKQLTAAEAEYSAQKLVIKRLTKTVRRNEDEMEKLQKQADKDQLTSRQRLADKTRILTELEFKVRELEAALEAAEGKSSRAKIREKARKEDEDIASTEIKVSSDRMREKRHAPPKIVKEERDDKEAEQQIGEKETTLSREEAASKIQRCVRKRALHSSVSVLQRALRGHVVRARLAGEQRSQSAAVIQTALKGAAFRNKHAQRLAAETEAEKPVSLPTTKSESSNTGRSKIVNKTKASDTLKRTEKSRPGEKAKQSLRRVAQQSERMEFSTDEDDLIMM